MPLRRLKRGLQRGLRSGLLRVRPAPHDREDRIQRTEEPGAPPGTLTTEPDSPPPDITVIAYGSDDLAETSCTGVAELEPLLEQYPVTWVNVDGLGDTDLIRDFGRRFGLHELTLEDIVHVDQRAKVELFADYLFIVVRMVCLGERLETEQLALVVGDRFVLTFQEGYPGDSLDPVRRRLRGNIGRLRREAPGYLAYALVDAVTDHYFPVLSAYGDRLDTLEDEVLADPADDIVSRIHDVKRDLLVLRRTIMPLREAVAALMRDETKQISTETKIHLRDVGDHAGQLADMLDSYREVADGLIDTHLSLAGHKMNEVMKVLTVIGSVFIPMTFITGLYGMNFDAEASHWNMPELHHPYGYPMALGAMLLSALISLGFFANRGWLGRRRR